MKNIVCFILILATEISSAQISFPQQIQQQEEQRKIQNTIIGVMVGMVAIGTAVIVAVTRKANKQAAIDEAKFQACVGKTKREIYTLYGPPNSIVDDAQEQGGTILEYETIRTSGGGKRGLYTTSCRKLFYLNKDNIVTSVKEDNH